ncbi:hypothetical protein F4861DRAFT_547150 [Xylaria intraflava]|nr:hypothetical protein F4861DRAFT_547150 [Xylaria intraflava]
MRTTNTKPWWNELCRRFTFIGRHTLRDVTTDGTPTIRSVCHLLDCDTRQDYYIVLPYDEELDRGRYTREGAVFETLKRYWGLLAPSIRIIEVDENDRLIGVSSDPAELIGLPEIGLNAPVSTFAHQRLEDVTILHGIETVNRSQLVEIDRLAPRVDFMVDTSRNNERIIVKWFLEDNSPQWQEIHTLRSLPAHPNIVQIHRIILDDNSGRVLGWASKQIAGTNLETDKSCFKMKWLKQLLDIVDYLHLELGICHCDLVLKNIMLERAADKILLVDFEFAHQINPYDMQSDINQIVWSVYEIVTHDSTLVEEQLCRYIDEDDEQWGDLNYHENDTSVIDDMKEWPVRTELDCEGQELRRYLKDWVDWRKAMGMPTPQNPVNLPQVYAPQPSDTVKMDYEARRAQFKETQKKFRAETDSQIWNAIRWERPPYATAYPDRAERILAETCFLVENMPNGWHATPCSESPFAGGKKRAAEDDDDDEGIEAKRAKLTPPSEDNDRCICQELGEESTVQADVGDDVDFLPIEVLVSVFGQECPIHEKEWNKRFSGRHAGFVDQLLGSDIVSGDRWYSTAY